MNSSLLNQQTITSLLDIPLKPSIIKSEFTDCRNGGTNDHVNDSQKASTNIINQNPTTSNEADFDQFSDDDEILLNISMDDLLVEENVEQSNGTIVENAIKPENSSNANIETDRPFIQIIDIFHELSKPEASAIDIKQFKIRAVVKKFNTKLTILTDESIPRWNLEVELGDGTATVICLLDDKFIAKRIGISAQQFGQMKHLKQSHKCKESINEFQESFRNCNFGIFTLLLCDKYNKLCVVDHVALDPGSVEDLHQNISQIVHGS